jgi:hypothetical protein
MSSLWLFRLFFCPLPIKLGLQRSVFLGSVDDFRRRKPLAWPGDGIPQRDLAISKDMDGPTRATSRHKIVLRSLG